MRCRAVGRVERCGAGLMIVHGKPLGCCTDATF
jgi:hypothetical protein